MFPALTIKKIAIQENVSTSTVRRWIKQGLPYYKIGNTIRIRQDEMEKFLARFKKECVLSEKLLINALTSLPPFDKYESKGDQGTIARKVKMRCLYFVINGEIRRGSIYERKERDGWKWAVNFIGPKGKRIRKKTNTQSEEKAGVFLKEEMERAFRSECSVEKDNVKFEEFAELYFVKYAKTNKES